MVIIKEESYKDVERSVTKYLEALYRHTWHVKGEPQLYLFGIPESLGEGGYFKIQNMHSREFLSINRQYRIDKDGERFDLYFKERMWNILALREEKNYSTALLDLEISEDSFIRLYGTNGVNPVDYIQGKYFYE